MGLPAVLKVRKHFVLEKSYKAKHFTASCSHEGLMKPLDKQRTTMQSAI